MQVIAADFNAFIRHFENMAPEVLLEAYRPTFEKSQAYCPKRTGALVRSGYLEKSGNSIGIGYGRGGTPHYAAMVHEDTTMPHQPPTRAKFLQSALDEDYNEILTRITKLSSFAAGMS
jgi:hypothetical protein